MHFEKSLSGCIGEKQVRTVAREGGGYGGKEKWMEIKTSEAVLMGVAMEGEASQCQVCTVEG